MIHAMRDIEKEFVSGRPTSRRMLHLGNEAQCLVGVDVEFAIYAFGLWRDGVITLSNHIRCAGDIHYGAMRLVAGVIVLHDNSNFLKDCTNSLG